MASKNKVLKGSGGQRLQPIRATQPFQLRQGSPARKSPSLSPTQSLSRNSAEVRRTKWSTSPDRGDRKSPSSPSVKVPSSHRTPSPRVWQISQESTVPSPITNTYLTGQWPREQKPPQSFTSCSKSTQTNPQDWNNEPNKPSKSTSRQSAYDGDANKVKQMKQQMRRIAKNRHDKKDRQSPVHGNHTALTSQQTNQPRPQLSSVGRGPRRHNSVEGLNKEIENISFSTEERKSQFGGTSDGRRAPFPRSTTRSMETQTPQEITTTSPSPSPDSQSQNSTNIPTNQSKGDFGSSPHPKYSSSPRPNNSYMFKREPPEGAESIKPFKEQEITSLNPSCPDKEKVHFHPSKQSRFCLFKKSESYKNNNTNSITNGFQRIALSPTPGREVVGEEFNKEIETI